MAAGITALKQMFRTSPVDYPRNSIGAKSEERPRCRYGTVARARARSIVKTNGSGDTPVQARRISSRPASFAHLTARARRGRASGPAGRLSQMDRHFTDATTPSGKTVLIEGEVSEGGKKVCNAFYSSTQ